MSTDSRDRVVRGLRALSAKDLVARYRAGERDFSRCNLLGPELAVAAAGVQDLSCLGHPACEIYNPLWIDFLGVPGERDFDWDLHGRCVSVAIDDAPTPRDLRGADLAGIRLSGSYVYPVDFSGGNLAAAALRRAVFIDCDLAGADLARCDMRDALFENCNLRGVNLYRARMDRVLMVGCDARSSNLRRARLYRARLIRADLRCAELQQAYCERLDLLESDIWGVDLSAVRLPAARIWGSRISRSQTGALLAALEVRIEQRSRRRPNR